MKDLDYRLDQNRHTARILRSRRWKFLAVLIAVALVLTVSSSRNGASATFIQSLILDVLSPFQKAFTVSSRSVRNAWQGYIYLVNVKKENNRLADRVKELQSDVNNLREAEMKLWRLQRLMGFNVEKHIETVPAEVVGRESDIWSRVILLNRGRDDGIERGMAVITSQGLVGRVAQTTANKSRILLITDWRSSVDALIQRSRERGVVVGTSKQVCDMRYIPLNADVRIGDKVVSSGLGGVFPKGLMVGTVVKVTKHRSGLFQRATVIPVVDAADVEEALVVLRYGE